MFKAEISADILRDSIKSISSIVDEAKFKITDSGIYVRAVDPANVAMVSLELTSDAFDNFEASELELGVDLVRLTDALDMAERNASVVMEFNDETHKLQLGIGGLSYTLALLDPSTIRKEPKVPQLDLATSVKIDGTAFKRLVKAAEKVGEYITLGIKGDIFFMEAEGDTDRV
ncbi:MAG: DNA polymerase sliding clamp, partial [Methanosarcinales archaeon]|nr:DNA polymerase sliding clamp [Methanosarcinales archaeon]